MALLIKEWKYLFSPIFFGRNVIMRIWSKNVSWGQLVFFSKNQIIFQPVCIYSFQSIDGCRLNRISQVWDNSKAKISFFSSHSLPNLYIAGTYIFQANTFSPFGTWDGSKNDKNHKISFFIIFVSCISIPHCINIDVLCNKFSSLMILLNHVQL